MNLQELTTEQLSAELKRREQEKEANRKAYKD
ncbi:hypothetical protein SAMN05421544_1404, partial [Riemerella columbipharyngis]